VIAGRALDQNGDGLLDSGADYWTSYLFHTRDMVRQTVVDVMQVIRVLGSFDGVRTWKYDANHDGKPDLAGDFDGDGVVDVGGSAPIHLVGGSLGHQRRAHRGARAQVATASRYHRWSWATSAAAARSPECATRYAAS